MTLPTKPPTVAQANAPLKEGASGWPVYALQSGINATPDGAFGPLTDRALRAFQRAHGLTVDGVAGPATRSKISAAIYSQLAASYPSLPAALPKRLGHGEGGDNPAAVNWTVTGGVDCGLYQLRVTGPPFSRARMTTAFSPKVAGFSALNNIVSRARVYAKPHAGCPFSPLELAVLAHNWPWAADRYFHYGTLPHPDWLAFWTPTSLPAADRTYAGWAAFYVKTMTT